MTEKGVMTEKHGICAKIFLRKNQKKRTRHNTTSDTVLGVLVINKTRLYFSKILKFQNKITLTFSEHMENIMFLKRIISITFSFLWRAINNY